MSQEINDPDLDAFLNTLDLPEEPKLEQPQPVKEPLKAKSVPASEDEWDDPEDFLNNSGLKRDRDIPEIEKPWMRHHKFTQVKTVEEVNQIVDKAIAAGKCSLDLETQGLDNRIVYDDNGKPQTVHKIVGFCLSYDGHEGFYIPVRHRSTDGGPTYNVGPVEAVEAAISRLCHAAIPPGTPEQKASDPLSWVVPGERKAERPQVVLYFWNAQFDQEFLYPITGIDWWHPESFEDGMLACFTKYAGDKAIGLKFKAKEMLKDKDGNPYEMINLKELFGKGMKIQFDLLTPDVPEVIRYAGSDAICTYLLCELPDFVPWCQDNKHIFTYRLEKQTSQVLRVMERNRVKVNRAQIVKLLEIQQAERDALLEKIRKFAKEQRGVNLDPNSPKQLGSFLFDPAPKGLDIHPKPEKNEASGQYKTDGETLESLAELPDAPSILRDIVEYRSYEKAIGTYLTGLAHNPDHNDELRFSFKQTGAATGRFSAPAGDPTQGYSGIPIHGIPAGSDLRRIFEARPGYAFAKCDYAAEELRIAANVSAEPVWIKEFLEGSGDLHSITARAFFGKQEVSKDERKAGKVANFALLYGGGPKSIIRATGCDEGEARRRKNAFDKAVPTFAKWIKTQHEQVKKNLGVWTAFDRWLSIPDARNVDGAIRAACERHSVNFQIQGAGADIMKIGLVKLHKEFYKRGWLKNGDDSVRMLLTVHDEIVFEIRFDRVAEAIPIIVDLMESPWLMPRHPDTKARRWKIPLVVEPLVGWNWSSGYTVERHKDGHKLGPNQTLMNGFVYHTTRKPAKDTELPDFGEVVEGGVFKLTDCPWVNDAPTAQNHVEIGSTPMPEAPVDAPTPIAPQPAGDVLVTVGDGVTDFLQNLETETTFEPVTPEPVTASTSMSDTTAETTTAVTLYIERLSDQTVQQVFDFIFTPEGAYEAGAYDPNGSVLHLAHITGETLIPPSHMIKVDVEKLKSRLRRYNLLSEA